jgi:DnaJ-domain-containing protein 1
MSLKKRLGFIARSYLTDFFDGDLTEKVGKSVRGLFESHGEDEERYEDIDLDELERKFSAEFGDLGGSTSRTSSRRPRRTRTRRPRSSKAKLAAHYKTMGIPEGTPFPKVRARFRKLMRQYHPDRYASDPKKQSWATKKTQAYSEAFAALEKALT